MSDSPSAAALISASQAESGGEVIDAFGFQLNDAGNAQRFARAHGRHVRYCADFGKDRGWLTLNALPQGGAVWRIDNIGLVDRYTKEVAANIMRERVAGQDIDKLKKWSHDSQQSGGLTAMKRLAQSEILESPSGEIMAHIPVTPDDFDADPWLLNLQNGTFDLRNEELHAPRPEDLLTKVAGTIWDPEAVYTKWAAFLDIIQPDRAWQRVMQEGIAYSLTGVTASPKALFVLWGASGDNGKSTFIETILALLGDYAKVTAINTFLETRDAQPHNIAALAGARFVSCSEPSEKARFDFASLKRISGGDRLQGCHKYGHPFEFDPRFKLWMATNPEPDIRRADNAFFNRYYLVPFTVRIEGKRREQIRELCDGSKDLKEIFREQEMPGILNWALEGLANWRATRDIEKPEAMLKAIARTRASQDQIADFLETILIDVRETEPSAKISKGDAHKAYLEYCRENSEKAMGKGVFGRMLHDRGYNADGNERDTTQNGKQVWFGLRYRRNDEGADSPGTGANVSATYAARGPKIDDGLFE